MLVYVDGSLSEIWPKRLHKRLSKHVGPGGEQSATAATGVAHRIMNAALARSVTKINLFRLIFAPDASFNP